ncbi:MAG TPA: cupin domain-containing protein [Cellvibrio sp.]|nr:cupin domain-containing protein [Cellvibrio sp.]
MTHPLTHLGDLPVENFLRDYWQKKPLLIRNALPGFVSPLDGDELAGLALEEEVESRLVLEKGKTPWELRHGPFEEKTFATLPETHWTLLVQAVDQWVPEVHELLQHFRFIPNWRLDDIMVSYAPDQGSVGPHFDYYDVFLLQGAGKRRWRIGQTCNVHSERVAGTSLNILKQFTTEEEWVLEPGDILYIPPGVAHWGIAEGECITYSIGFRAPSHADILCELTQDIATRLTNDQRFSDPDLTLQTNPGEISHTALQQLKDILLAQLTDENLAHWFGKHMTERKYAEEMERDDAIETDGWQTAMRDDNLLLWRHPAARFAYHALPNKTLLFVDGQAFNCSRELAETLCQVSEIDWATLEPLLKDPLNLPVLNALIHQESLLLDE